MLLSVKRARMYMITDEVITADQALRLGLVKELVPRERVLRRAWEIARRVAQKCDRRSASDAPSWYNS